MINGFRASCCITTFKHSGFFFNIFINHKNYIKVNSNRYRTVYGKYNGAISVTCKKKFSREDIKIQQVMKSTKQIRDVLMYRWAIVASPRHKSRASIASIAVNPRNEVLYANATVRSP